MSAFFGPLDSKYCVPPHQQTRVSAFLISAHGALARQFVFILPTRFQSAWQTELNAQVYREAEIMSLLLRSTSWVPDLALPYMTISWETAWLPTPIEGIPDRTLAAVTGLATLAHAVHASIRPAALLPVEANSNDPFVMALRRIELDSGRLLQAQALFLKSPDLLPFRDAVSSALERHHTETDRLWTQALEGVGIAIARTE